MKTKSIILTALSSVLLGASVVSCEDMLRTESSIVIFEDEGFLNQPTDTVYSFMGIVQKMQGIADRSVLLGELRGDLVSVTENANQDLKDLADFNFSVDNSYNSVVDYYAVINNCNYYLAKADTALTENTKNVFLREWVAIQSFRAWTYLQLAQVYGKVPYVTEPILSGDKANADDYKWLDIKEIAKELIPGLEPYTELAFPQYGSIGDFKSDNICIPVRLILGDLYLWAGEYKKAAKMYHDYLSSQKNHVYTYTTATAWKTKDFLDYSSDYTQVFTANNKNQVISLIPMQTEEYDGTVTYLYDLYNSTEDNKNYFQATYSKKLANLSANQIYCYDDIDPNTYRHTSVYVDPINQQNTLEKGDLRLRGTLDLKTIDEDDVNAGWSKESQTIKKIFEDRVWIYRVDQVYLRFAEALNRAGFPESAFAILKYGLCERNINDYISQEERDRAAADGLLEFSVNYFTRYQTIVSQGSLITSGNTRGIHSRGSGSTDVNALYVLPDTTDVNPVYAGLSPEAKQAQLIKEVEELISDEMALELSFEGYRFGDLMRIAYHRGEAEGNYSDNAFLADRVAERNGSIDAALQTLLTGDGKSYNRSWFMPLP